MPTTFNGFKWLLNYPWPSMLVIDRSEALCPVVTGANQPATFTYLPKKPWLNQIVISNERASGACVEYLEMKVQGINMVLEDVLCLFFENYNDRLCDIMLFAYWRDFTMISNKKTLIFSSLENKQPQEWIWLPVWI